MKRGKKKKISIIRPLLHCRDINLNYPLFHPSRERRRCSRTRRLSSNGQIQFRISFHCVHSSCTRNFITPSYNKTTNKYAQSTRVDRSRRVTKHPLRTMTGEILNPTKAFPRRAKLYRVFRYSPQLKH